MISFDDMLKDKHDEMVNHVDNTLPDKKPVDKKSVKQVLKEDTPWTEEEKENIEKKFINKFKLDYRGTKKLKKRESKEYQFKQQFIIGMATLGIFFLLAMYFYAPQNDTLFLLILLIGVFMNIPIGMVFGWVLIDPFMRCKIMRKVSKRNFGIVNFVGKGKKMVTRIKNFDHDLVWIGNKCWVLTKAAIYELDKYGDTIVEGGEIKPENIVSVTETVPVLFIDLDSMEPLSLKREFREKIQPEELGATLKGWIDNQMAKVSFLKKTMDIYFMIVIVSALAAAALSYMIYTEQQTMAEDIESIKNTLSLLAGK